MKHEVIKNLNLNVVGNWEIHALIPVSPVLIPAKSKKYKIIS
jgi:hypothetical protein